MNHSKSKDARYRLSRETGAIIKDWGGRIPVALIYPDSYYVGMSNLGIHAIYRLLNSYPDVVSERVFREKENQVRSILPLSVETQRPLADFAVLAFSISYELDYFNIAPILKASGIPVYAAERDESHPLVIAGGPCITANPMPLSPFFDCLCIGEAEVILPAILPVLAEGIRGNRRELLEALASLPGVFVPQYHNGKSIVRQWLANLDDFLAHSVILTPDTELGNLYLIEVERGCHWNCRFCLVSTAFCPVRYHSLEVLLEQAQAGLKYRKRMGLVGPAVTGHPHFEKLLTGLQQLGAEISVSSLRIKPLSPLALGEIARGGARTIALAPEAGSQRLRRVIRKGINEDDILAAIRQVARQNIAQLKLYFMIGLPTETDDDIEEIVSLVLKCKAILDKQRNGSRITLSVAPFVPKASTPFQWLAMEESNTLNRRLALLKRRLLPGGIAIKSESVPWSQVQATLARGDSRLAAALADVNEVSLSGWRQAMRENHLDADFYAHQRLDTGTKLPWVIIDSGAKTGHLESELKRAMDLSTEPSPER